MLNLIELQGRLTKDVELRYTSSEIPIASFTLAVERDYIFNGEKATDFINCVAWNKKAEFVSRYFAKGNMMLLTGSLQARKYVDRDGNNRTVYEVNASDIHFCESKKSDAPAVSDLQPVPVSDVPDPYGALDNASEDLPF